MDNYAFFGIDKKASPNDIIYKYREHHLLSHLNNDKTNMAKIEEIYNLIMNDKKNNIDNKIDEEIYKDIDIKVNISFEESYFGCEKNIEIIRMIMTNKLLKYENDRIRINIYKGINNGEIIVLPHLGNIYEDIKTNINIQVNILDDEIYERDKLNIIYKYNISFKESIMGFNKKIKLINNEEFILNSSKGNVIINGDKKKIKNKGIDKNNEKGDLIILFKVNRPTKSEIDKLISLYI